MTSDQIEKDYLLVPTDGFKLLKPSLVLAAQQIRKAINENRPIVVSHHNDTDGTAAGILLERAIVAAIKFKHGEVRYMQNYFVRNPSKTPYYDFGDASKDISQFLMNMQRSNLAAPLVIITDNGSTKQDVPSIQKVKLYGADVIVVDHHDPGELSEGKSAVCNETLAHVNPHLVGLNKDFSAAMLCFQLAYYINSHHHVSYTLAALGGVADHCEGETMNGFIEKSELSREYLRQLYLIVEYELYNNRYYSSEGVLTDLMDNAREKRDALIALYKPILEAGHKSVLKSVQHFVEEQMHNDISLRFINAEDVTLWGDYYSIGKIAGITQEHFEDKGISVAYSNQVIVFRSEEGLGFDVNELIAQLQNELPYGRISGGGHNVAGSIKFVSGVQKQILTYIEKYVKNLKC